MDCGYLLLYGKADFWKVIKICAGVFKRNIWIKSAKKPRHSNPNLLA